MQSMAIEVLPIGSLRPYAGNARAHSKKQIRQLRKLGGPQQQVRR
jgi:hypothetical protein